MTYKNTHTHTHTHTRARVRVGIQEISRTHRGKRATYLIAEYHRGRLQSTPLGKLCTDASTWSTLQNNFGNNFVEWPSELPLYFSCHQCHQNAYLLIRPLTSGTEKVTGC